jgi:predicted transcriptional regulator
MATDMRRTVPVATRVSQELKEKLATLAKNTKRSESDLITQAIADYLDLNAWQASQIKERLDQAEAGAPAVSHEGVIAWLDSWGTGQELPPPKAGA